MTASRKDDRYFAIPDPDNPEQMTYWREHDGRTGASGRALDQWPAKARYGPRLLRSDVPKTPRAARGAVLAEHRERVMDWYSRVREAINADRVAAGKRFADWCIRCCFCGRALTEEHSKVYGIGPECRSGIPAGVLAEYMTPQVGRLHAAHLAKVP